MVLAVRAAQLGKKKALITFPDADPDSRLRVSGIKYVGVSRKVGGSSHPRPGLSAMPSRSTVHQAQILFFLYFAMTGMHALHMIVGAGLLTTLIVMASRNRFSAEWYTPVEMIGLVLALRRYRLDFPVSVAVPDRTHIVLGRMR